MKTRCIRWSLLAVAAALVPACGGGGGGGGGAAPPTAPPGAFTLVSPANGAGGVSLQPTFSWTSSSQAASYRFQLSDSLTFSAPLVDASGITGTAVGLSVSLTNSTVYYWRVTAVNASGNTLAAGAPDTFRTNGPAPGGLDASFGGTGRVTTHFGSGDDEARAVAVQPDGRIVAAGYAEVGGGRDFALIRLWP